MAKAIGLLAYLAVTEAPQTRDHLVDLFWPDSLPEAARKNLRNTLWAIRKGLGDEVLQTDAERLALADGVWCDVQRFVAAAQALATAETPTVAELQTAVDLYRAPLLDGLATSDAADFEIWLTTERERLGQLYQRLLETLVARHRVAGNWTEVMAIARRALAYDNLQEPMHRALIEAHARLGERPEALRQYDLLRTTLDRELSVEPLPESEALRRAILSGELQSVEAAAPAAHARPRRARMPVSPPDLPLVGRQRELVALDEELDLAAGGLARVVLFSGELGIGKSRLWREWSANLPPEITALETRCLDTTQSLPFAPLTGLFREQACVETLLKPPSPVSPIWLAELARLLPEIREFWPGLTVPATLPAEEERHRLFEAFTQTLRALESRPLILFIDDLHWADRATVDWLLYLVDRMRAEPLLLVGAYRPNDAQADLIHRVASLGREGVVRRLPLARLTLAETTTLLAALGTDGARAEQLQTRSAGNPYFLLELSRTGLDGTPAGLAELVRDRFKQLPEAAYQVLQSAAVLESDFSFAELRRTSGRGEEETLDALDSLLEAALLVERGERYEFTHLLVATVVQGDLSIARRSFLHRRAAEALEATHAGSLDQIAGRLTLHYAQAGRPAQAASYAELAAKHAASLAAPAEAEAFYRRALALEATPARRLGLGYTRYTQGDLEEGRAAFTQAMVEFVAQGDDRGAAQARLALADSYLASGQGDLIIQWAKVVLQELDPQADPEAIARAHLLLSAADLLIGRSLSEAERHLIEATQLAGEYHLPAIAAQGQFALGNVLAERGDYEEAVQVFAQSIVLAQAAGNLALEVYGHNNLAYHALLAHDLDTAQAQIESGMALAQEHALFIPWQYLYSTRGEIALAQGQLDEAESFFHRALSEAEKHGNQLQVANIGANLSRVARERGDSDGALILLTEASRAVREQPALHLHTQIDLWLAELYIQRGERAAAKDAWQQAERRLKGSGRHGLAAWATRIEAALQG
ncbi:MAG: AAA family ATPase [Ardenticatenales bacterium]|nr:AAA family ATPase [Ardenticatenales bacterium]